VKPAQCRGLLCFSSSSANVPKRFDFMLARTKSGILKRPE
jgi:hypothetical protein